MRSMRLFHDANIYGQKKKLQGKALSLLCYINVAYPNIQRLIGVDWIMDWCVHRVFQDVWDINLQHVFYDKEDDTFYFRIDGSEPKMRRMLDLKAWGDPGRAQACEQG